MVAPFGAESLISFAEIFTGFTWDSASARLDLPLPENQKNRPNSMISLPAKEGLFNKTASQENLSSFFPDLLSQIRAERTLEGQGAVIEIDVSSFDSADYCVVRP